VSAVPAALLFDFGGTLDADGVAWRERFFRIWREEAGDVASEDFDPAFYAADDSLVGAVDPATTLTETVQRLARGVAHRLGADPSTAERAAARFTRDSLETLGRRAPLLARLARRRRLGVVSNFYGNLAGACREAGIAGSFSVLVDSCDVGCSKPEPAIFRAALDRLGARASEALFVGDSIERDMAGARGIGMPHLLLKPADAGDPFLCCPEDGVIRRLEEVEEAVS
jgi:HAD superfamily hydrolase (TIGR01509 family)